MEDSIKIKNMEYRLSLLEERVSVQDKKIEDMIMLLGATACRLNGFIDATNIVSEEKIEKHIKKMIS